MYVCTEEAEHPTVPGYPCKSSGDMDALLPQILGISCRDAREVSVKPAAADFFSDNDTKGGEQRCPPLAFATDCIETQGLREVACESCSI